MIHRANHPTPSCPTHSVMALLYYRERERERSCDLSFLLSFPPPFPNPSSSAHSLTRTTRYPSSWLQQGCALFFNKTTRTLSLREASREEDSESAIIVEDSESAICCHCRDVLPVAALTPLLPSRYLRCECRGELCACAYV